MTLNKRLEKVKKVFNYPWHFFSLTENGEVMLIIENNEGQRKSFRGKNIKRSIESAEGFVKKEQKMGSLREKNNPKKDTENKEEKKDSEEKDNKEEVKEKPQKGEVKKADLPGNQA